MELATCKIYCKLYESYVYNKLKRPVQFLQRKTSNIHIGTFMTYTIGCYDLSLWILWAKWMSLSRIVTLMAWMAHRLVSSNSPMK